MQKINYVPRERVLHWIEQQSQSSTVPYGLDWGTVTEPRLLIDVVNTLKRTPDDMIDMSRLAKCFQSFYTNKMLGPANRKLIQLWALCKTDRVRRYKCQLKNT